VLKFAGRSTRDQLRVGDLTQSGRAAGLDVDGQRALLGERRDLAVLDARRASVEADGNGHGALPVRANPGASSKPRAPPEVARFLRTGG
jgi:hypothetical protein